MICEDGSRSIGVARARASSANTSSIVYVETYPTAMQAITREKQLKNWRRDWKIELIKRDNLDWNDLSGLICGR